MLNTPPLASSGVPRSARHQRKVSLLVRGLWLFVALLFVAPAVVAQSVDRIAAHGEASKPGRIVIDDFESYSRGALPDKWRAQLNGDLVPLTAPFFNDREYVETRKENGNGFMRARVEGETVHVGMDNGTDFEWDTGTHPLLSWDWRAVQLPEGSREDEDRLNDSGAGIYIVFSIGGTLIKRPKIIKYVYSAVLPVGTMVSYGKLKVVVASSALEATGTWQRVQRDVVADYERVFNEAPPRHPLRLRLWSDADNTGSVAIADFDNIALLPRP